MSQAETTWRLAVSNSLAWQCLSLWVYGALKTVQGKFFCVRFSFFCFLCFSTLFWHAKCWNIISVFRAVFPLLGRISVNSFSCWLLPLRSPCTKNNKNSHTERKNLWGITLWRGLLELERGRERDREWEGGDSAEFVVVVATWQIPYVVCATCCGVLTVLFTMLIEPSTGWQVK